MATILLEAAAWWLIAARVWAIVHDVVTRFPFPIPNGWFQIAYTADLGADNAIPLRYFGRQLHLIRDKSGEPRLFDAFFPQPWPITERNKIIWAWHHAQGSPPSWQVPEMPQADDPEWTEYRCYEWRVATHNQEMGENAVDRAHFKYVHGAKTVPDSEVEFEGHIRKATQHLKLKTPRGVVDGAIRVQAHGMGCTITEFTGICDTVALVCHTPVDEHNVHSRFSFTQRRADVEGPRGGVARAVIADIVKQMNEDIPIWENKQYLSAPMLCDGDGPIGPYRKWAAQFY